MKEHLTLLAAVLPVFFIVGAGATLRWLNWLKSEADASLFRITIYVLTPCLILDSLLGNEALSKSSNVIVPPLIGFATVLVGVLITSVFLNFMGLKEPAVRRTFVFAIAVYNYGYLPIPLALILFGRETVGVLFVHNVGVETALWTLGLMFLRGRGLGSSWRQVLNPPLAAITVSLALNLSKPAGFLPDWIVSLGDIIMAAVGMLGKCAIPLGLILIGATMADYRDAFVARKGFRVITWACLIRLGLMPLLILCIPKILPLSTELKQVLVLQAAMPSAVFSIVMARHYGGDTSTALRVVIATTFASLFLIPIWLRFGLKFLAL